jgi:hypothetical protein
MNDFHKTFVCRRICTIVGTTVCLMAGSAPAFAQDEPDTEADEASKDIVLKLDYASKACAANLSLWYYQRDENAHVKSVLTNEDCAASSGEYTLQVRFRDSRNEVLNIDYTETWERADASPVVNATDYYMGEDVDLIRVRSRKLKCVCSEADDNSASSETGDNAR